MKTTNDYTQPIRERLAAATEGPWIVFRNYRGIHDVGPMEPGHPGYLDWDKQVCSTTYHDSEYSKEKPNAEFIANAPTDISNLLAERDALRAALTKSYRELNAIYARDGAPCSYMGVPLVDEEYFGVVVREAREALDWQPKEVG